jgi:hypothetical protein
MTTTIQRAADDYLALEVEDYASRPRLDEQSTTGEKGSVSIPVLLWATLAIAAFVAVAVWMGQIAGAC